MKPTWDEMCAVADLKITQILADLPPELRERASTVPVAMEKRPSKEMQAYGIEEDTLGLFTGPEWVDEGESVMPAQIILYLENIAEMVETDEKRFGDEIATTFLHELGHFLGLDEDGLSERGLD